MTAGERGTLGAFTLAMMTVAAVVSLRGLPMMAKEGLELLFYIGFCTLLFLLPASLVAAELGSAFAERRGGIYAWAKAAFGPRIGFLAIWLQWIQNVVWYPTILAFAAGALAYLFGRPELAGVGWYNAAVILTCYWLATLVTFFGVGALARLTKWFLILGTLLPGLIVIVLGLLWLLQGNPIAFLAEAAAGEAGRPHARFFPHIDGLGSIAFLAGILLLFAGVEVQAVHAGALRQPARQFPAALFIAMAVIFGLFTLGALSVAVVVPAETMSLTAGLMQALQVLLERFGLGEALPLLGLLVAFGAIGGVMAWVGGPCRGLLATAEEGALPKALARTNARGAPVAILLIQGGIVTLLSLLYLIMEDVSVAFFLLSAMTVTLYLVMYMIMYAAALRLRYSQPDLPRSYRVPGGKPGIWLVAGGGLLAVVFAFVVGFFPPAQLPVGSPGLYVGLVAGGLLVFIGVALLLVAKPRAGLPDEASGKEAL
ncbi:MAG: amino acid permease [Rhodospirillales bacterium]